jgi:hypothetical protein
MSRKVKTIDDALVLYRERNLTSDVISHVPGDQEIQLGSTAVYEGREWIEVTLVDGSTGYALGPSVRGHTTLGDLRSREEQHHLNEPGPVVIGLLHQTQDASQPSTKPHAKSMTSPETISPALPVPLCWKCNIRVTSEMEEPGHNFYTAFPYRCESCSAWFHSKCAEGSNLCPACLKDGNKRKGKESDFYCEKCAKKVAVVAQATWPEIPCAKCKVPVSVAILRFGAKRELAMLIAAGTASLIALLVAMGQDATQSVLIFFGALAAVFALPWLCLLAGLLATAFVPSLGMGKHVGRVDKLPLESFKQFQVMSLDQRLWWTYLWALYNAGAALIIAIVGFGFMYAVSTSNR